MTTTLSKKNLIRLYLKKKKSTQDIAILFNCSVNRVRYWMKKYGIQPRPISEAIYIKNNPNGDPFKIKKPNTINNAVLFGMGLGLYWGEGTKANRHSVRLGNTDSELIKKFILFLVRIFGIKKRDLKFGLQIFNDIKEEFALGHWTRKLEVKREQFYKSSITKSVRKGTYGKKSEFGVLTIYYNNKKMRDALMNLLEEYK